MAPASMIDGSCSLFRYIPKGSIDKFVALLKSYNDKNLSEELYGKNDEIKKLVDQFINYA